MMISEHNQIDKKLSNKEIGSPITGFFWLTPLYNGVRLVKKKNTAKINRQKLFLVLNPANLCRVIV